jgi:uncharacterized membrane protein
MSDGADIPSASNAAPHQLRQSSTCAISGVVKAKKGLTALGALRPQLQERICKDHPQLQPDAMISRAEIDRYRGLCFEELIAAERGEVTRLDREVAESLARQELISENLENCFEDKRTLGERWADALASFGGSWRFLIIFAVVLVVWMAANVAMGDRRAFDPFPFILLNLVLSCLAAVQAPVIMMSQKRQEAKDRARSLGDYKVNFKAELEIRHLHEKIDHLLQNQWERLTEIQMMQLEMLQRRPGGR